MDHYPFDSGADPARLATLRDALSLASGPPPVVPPPGVGGPLVPPGPTPFAPQPASRFVKRGIYMVCTTCDMAVEWCACGKQPAPAVQSKDGGESSIERRARECMGGR